MQKTYKCDLHEELKYLPKSLNVPINTLVLLSSKQIPKPTGINLGTPGGGVNFYFKRNILNAFYERTKKENILF